MHYSKKEALEPAFLLRVFQISLALILCFVVLFSTSIVKDFIDLMELIYLADYAWSLRISALMVFYYLVKKNFI